MRGSQSDRFVQGPGHGPRGLEGGRGRSARDRLRIDREHGGICSGVRGTGRDRGRHRARSRRAGQLEARTGARGRRAPGRGRGHLRRRVHGSRGARRARGRGRRQLDEPGSDRRSEDRGTRDRRAARRTADRARSPLRGRRQHGGLREGLPGVRRAGAPDPLHPGGRPRHDERLCDPDPDSGPPRRG